MRRSWTWGGGFRGARRNLDEMHRRCETSEGRSPSLELLRMTPIPIHFRGSMGCPVRGGFPGGVTHRPEGTEAGFEGAGRLLPRVFSLEAHGGPGATFERIGAMGFGGDESCGRDKFCCRRG